ncbi:MAG: hypothetical protein MAG453_01276 [Calditrichaeota bacterium]|nr:hypothetical protein [Calditrichota bacterium]
MSLANLHLFEIVRLSERMLDVARKGTEDRPDAECAIVYGTLHDYAMHLRKLALEEVERHRRMGVFDDEDVQAYELIRSSL